MLQTYHGSPPVISSLFESARPTTVHFWGEHATPLKLQPPDRRPLGRSVTAAVTSPQHNFRFRCAPQRPFRRGSAREKEKTPAWGGAFTRVGSELHFRLLTSRTAPRYGCLPFPIPAAPALGNRWGTPLEQLHKWAPDCRRGFPQPRPERRACRRVQPGLLRFPTCAPSLRPTNTPTSRRCPAPAVRDRSACRLAPEDHLGRVSSQWTLASNPPCGSVTAAASASLPGLRAGCGPVVWPSGSLGPLDRWREPTFKSRMLKANSGLTLLIATCRVRDPRVSRKPGVLFCLG